MVNPYRVGLWFGIFMALWHTCWSALVATGYAQALMDFVFWAHFISPVYHVEPFEISRAPNTLNVTISIGIASAQSEGDNAEGLLHRADQALYRAKREGRNRVIKAAA